MAGRPITQYEVEEEITRLGAELESATEAYAEKAQTAAESEVQYKVEYAKAYLRARGTVAERETTATVNTENQLRAYKVNEALMKASQQKLVTLRAHIDWLRSINANVRSQV